MDKLCKQVRPNGKTYNARKPPTVHVFDAGWPENNCIMVLRISEEDQHIAHEMATAEGKRHDFDMVSSGYFGWWRDSIRNREQYWDWDSVRGVPGWYFNVE